MRYYLVVMLFYVVIVFAIASVWMFVTSENSRGYSEAQMRGTHYLVEQRYLGAPHRDWPALTQELRSHFAYPLKLVEVETLRSVLTAEEQQRLLRGELVMESENETHTFQRLPGTMLAVALGDFDDVSVRGVPWSDLFFIDSIVTIAIFFIAVALPLYFLVYRFWRDLRKLRDIADALSAGELGARAPEVATRLVNPLGHALNQMAGQVQQLMESQRILAQAVAHEIRTPLARMRFGLEMLDTTAKVSERGHVREGLESDIQRLEHLAEQSVTYARIGRVVSVERRPIKVASLFADLADLFESEPPMRLSFNCHAVAMINANREALELALCNLIANGLRHAHVRVAVSIAEEAGQHVLLVEDDGEGVPEAERGRVFQPFTQLHKHAEGFGLGLALVRVVAQKHGGYAAVADSPLGGACFRIGLPIR
ncbi:ATP-binding protein [Lysobacter sp. CA196]|uniref:ATP-binding protein n=1 Tax=Lysobacter sp. CA196 TaxID=3455606 RepID=UPI003F8D6DB6